MIRHLLSPKVRGTAGAWIVFAAIAPGIVIMVDGIAMLIGQIGGWLKTGVWQPHSVFEPLHEYLGMEYPKVSWWAAQKVADLLMSFPASLALFVGGYFLMLGIVLLIAYPLHWLGLSPAEEGNAS